MASAPHELLNALAPDEARSALRRCCGSSRWVDAMLARRPFPSAEALYAASAEIAGSLAPEDWREAFSHHPRIGGGAPAAPSTPLAEAEPERLRDTATWSRAEQARVAEASEQVLRALHAANDAYFARFGYIFIVCATGKSAPEMLALLEARLAHPPGHELAVAAAEQLKITRLRLEKLTP